MIGTRIESSPQLPMMSLILGAGWLISLALALVLSNVHFAIGGISLACLALARWLYREQRVSLEVEHEGLSLNDASQIIEYSAMRSLSPNSKRSKGSQFAFDVIYTDGVLHIPASIDQSSEALIAFLRSRLSPQPRGFVNPVLESHLLEQLKLFGAQKVFCFSPRENTLPTSSGKTRRMIGLGMITSGLLWGLSGTLSELWIVPGIIQVILGGIIWLASYAKRDSTSRHVKNWKESTLLVTPTGIALVQGNLKGKLRWDEVLSVKMTGIAPFGMTHHLSGLSIQVAGSQLTILDLYNEPLPVIQQRIMDYYSGSD